MLCVSVGILYDEIGKKEYALIDYSNAIYLNPKNAKYFYKRGGQYDILIRCSLRLLRK